MMWYVLVFEAGDEATIRRNLAAFIVEMDDRGEGYGVPSDDPACEPNLLYRDHGVIFGSDDHHVLLILGGTAWVRGADDQADHVGAGSGVLWSAREPWTIEVDEEPLVYLDADGPALRLDHFAAR
jgi:hypothetical protein